MNNTWLNEWYEKNTADTSDISITNDIFTPIVTNGSGVDWNTISVDMTQINTHNLVFSFPDADIEFTHKELKVMKRLIEHFGKELFPEEYV